MSPIPSRWRCEVCQGEYETEAEAAACESHPLDTPAVQVGDIVTCGSGSGWYDGSREWIQNADAVDPRRIGGERPLSALYPERKCPKGHGNCFSECCNFTFLRAVTLIDHEPGDHRARYHVETRAMTGKQGYQLGYTFDDHRRPTRVKASRRVVKEAQALIGHRASHLL